MLITFRILLFIFMFSTGALLLGSKDRDKETDLIITGYIIAFCVSTLILFLTFYTLD